MQLGFVIDHSRCIGCHACTVACKSENEVPVGDFRTWVKYTESGSFPEVRRSFAVLRCNQCSDAPCVAICPTRALEKRADGIVDVDADWCIGCKSCMQGCPYDALYINPGTGTAEKCHFCAHRTELGLAPACAIVCPTEAIIPGDFHDPASRVSTLRASGKLEARKIEAGTGPNVWYREVDEAGVDPLKTNAAAGYLWAARADTPQRASQEFEAREHQVLARTVYDAERSPVWGWKISAYLFTKSLAAGIGMVVALRGMLVGAQPADFPATPPVAALGFLVLTTGLLIADLKRPSRFLYMLLRPNTNSWVTKGAWVLSAYGFFLAVWAGLAFLRWEVPEAVARVVFGLNLLAGGWAAAYTAALFGQARGRPLWMKRGLAAHLIVQAMLAGFALLFLVYLYEGHRGYGLAIGRICVSAVLLVHGSFALLERSAAPLGREKEYARAAALLTHGPYRWRHWVGAVGLGIVLPLLLLVLPVGAMAWGIATVMILAGLFLYEDNFVRAGQALPIS